MRLAPMLLVLAIATPALAYPDMSLIRREIRVKIPEIRKCYDKALRKDPKLEGTVIATFTISATGAVTEATASGLPGVDECVVAKIKTIKFPASAKGDIVINYPFAFRPAAKR